MLFLIGCIIWFITLVMWIGDRLTVINTVLFIGLILSFFYLDVKRMQLFRKKKDKSLTNSIARETIVNGDLTIDSKLYIYGTVNGNIKATARAKVVIANGGKVNGYIQCDNIIINGDLHGECTCQDIEIHENGLIDGNVWYDNITIKDGGAINGKLIRHKQIGRCDSVTLLSSINCVDV
ncbi:polymer-forming cytoskeletal protein [Salmonella enterica]|nr:polymer-forming cytoskeletal protein [Salmonella enterica]EAZ9261379.1 polymer-forming cytoskeletal protein [Salmonella enterica]EBN2521024.1 polymer-forming cytoskeletal protein [Salmonella enterica]